MKSPAFREVVRDCQRSHRHWHKVRFIARGQSTPGRPIDPELVWLVLKMNRENLRHDLPLQGARGEQVHYIVPDGVQRDLMLIDRDLAGSLGAADAQPLDESQRERFILNALREEAIASSMLEGASTTRSVAKAMLQSGRRPRGRGERMVLNNYNAIQFVREHRTSDLTPEFLLELQAMITE